MPSQWTMHGVEREERMDTRTTRWGAVAGIAFVVLFVAGNYLILQAPGASDTGAERADFYANNANTIPLFVAMYLIAVAGLAFLWFMAGLRSLLRPAGETAWFVAVGSGVVFVAMLLVGLSVDGVQPVNALFADNEPQLGAETVRTLAILGRLPVAVGGALAMALLIAVVSRLGHVAGAFPGWLTVTGYLAALIVVFSILFVPMVAMPLWVLIVSLFLLYRQERTPAPEMA
jgi:archaellum biogenesis protein FlaJ (TadC family)